MSKLKIVAVVLIMCILMAENSLLIVKAETTEQDAVDEKVVTEENVNVFVTEKITVELEEKLTGMSDEQEILVSIQLIDNIDMDVVNVYSYNQASVGEKGLERKQEQAKSYAEKANEETQQEMIEEYDKAKKEYNNRLAEYYTELCSSFVEQYIQGKKVSEYYYSPFIDAVMMSKADIYELAENEMVEKIYYHNVSFLIEDYDSVNNTYKVIGGDTAVNNGYKGSGIKVGIIESGNPNTSLMGSDGGNIIKVKATKLTEHSTLVAGIIKKFAPNCTIYSYGISSDEETISAIETLITKYNVHVINISAGSEGNGVYDSYSNRVDYLAYKYRIPIVVAAGNSGSTRDTLNRLCMGPNVIAVGAVESSGNSMSNSNFKYWIGQVYKDGEYKNSENIDSAYKESMTVINKPDVCAPGVVSMYGLNDGGTSFSAPHVTGTIVQMMSRNSGMIGKPEALKATLIASAHFKAYTNGKELGNITNSNNLLSDLFGAGVIDADFCYWVARNGRQNTFVVTKTTAASNTMDLSKQIWVDSISRPLRVAISWSASHYYNTGQPYCNDYDIRIYKNGKLLKTSNAWTNSNTYKNTNCEIIELEPILIEKNGAGYYEVRIVRTGAWQGSETVKYYIGMAWEQY